MIVDRIYDFLGGARGEMTADKERLLDVAGIAFRRTLSRNLLEDRVEERRNISPSSAWYCGRRMLYGIRGEPREPGSPRSAITFTWGDTAEAMALLLARVAGVPLLSPGEDGAQQVIDVPVGGEWLKGHMDATIDVHGVEVPIDVKSMSDMGFGDIEAAIRSPDAKWWAEHKWDIVTQLRLYMRALEAKQGKQVNVGIVIAVNKNTGHLAELHIPRDEAHLATLDAMMLRLRAHEAAGTVPDRPAWATSTVKDGDNLRGDGSRGAVEEITSWRCGYCPFIRSCWAGFDFVPLKSKPAWRRAL